MNELDEQIERLRLLTEREIDVLRLRIQGLTQKKIADALVITERTVKFHLGNIYEKFDIAPSTESQAVRFSELQKFAKAIDMLTKESLQSESAFAPANTKELEPHQPSSDVLVLVLEDELELVKREATAIEPSVIRIPPYDSSATGYYQPRRSRMALYLLSGALMIGILLGVSGMAILFTLRDTPLPSVASEEPVYLNNSSDEPTSIEQLPPTSSEVLSALPAEAVPPVKLCGETEDTEYTVTPQFLRHQGVSVFASEGSNGAILNDYIRSLALDSRGLWIGYAPTGQNPTSGVGLYTRKNWIICQGGDETSGLVINDIEIDSAGRVWVATDGAGVSVFDGEEWYTYTLEQGLPSNAIFSLTIDSKGAIWAATLAGVATLEGNSWKVPYSAANSSLVANKTHALAFDSQGDIWVGQIEFGVSHYNNATAEWEYYSAEPDGLGGDQIRDIVVRKANADIPESIWFATADGGLSKFEQGKWTVYRVEDGLPSNHVSRIALDKYNRVWVATEGGVAYLEGTQWVTYNTLGTKAIAFGPTCQECPINDDHVWTGTVERGLTHSRLPHLNNNTVVKIAEVCFELIVEKQQICVPIQEAEVGQTQLVSATLPASVNPGTRIRFKVTAIPRAPYQLRQDRGDFLANTDADERQLYSTWPQIPVEGTIEPGQPFMFAGYDSAIVAPELDPDVQEQTFTSHWRVWMHTRYVGPVVQLVFTVRAPEL
jgi:DNA-binding CsgD family transcriptional regulator